jgi:hypothetical protein
MKSFKQFLSESINIAGDFNGTLNIGSASQPEQVGESYIADVVWQGSIYRMEVVSEGMPTNQKLSEDLQGEYPGAIVHNIYPVSQKSVNIKNSKRYHPTKLDWF